MKTFKIVYTFVDYTVVTINDENEPVMDEGSEKFSGTVSEEKARKLIRELYNGESIIKINACETKTEKRQISINDLVEHSELVEENTKPELISE